jgi:hypothetical protein
MDEKNVPEDKIESQAIPQLESQLHRPYSQKEMLDRLRRCPDGGEIFIRLERKVRSLERLLEAFVLPVILDHYPKSAVDLLYGLTRPGPDSARADSAASRRFRTKKQIRFFYRRIEKFAREIEAFIDLVVDPNDPEVPIGYETLPTVLREFASIAKRHGEIKLEIIQCDVWTWQDGATVGFLNLVSFVARSTGSPHYPAIANLLTAVASVLGFEKEYSEDQLKQLAFRSRRR